MDQGDKLYFFDSLAGKFIVLICEDFRNELNNVLSQVADLDFLFVISYNPNPKRFHEIAAPIPGINPLYIVQSNVAEINSKFGGSCIFGVMDTLFAEKLTKERSRPESMNSKVTEIPSPA